MINLKRGMWVTLLSSAALMAMTSTAHAANCSGVNIYPNWTKVDWKGDPSHANTNDLMKYGNKLYRAKWWTQSVPGSDGSWEDKGTCVGTDSSTSSSGGSSSGSTSSSGGSSSSGSTSSSGGSSSSGSSSSSGGGSSSSSSGGVVAGCPVWNDNVDYDVGDVVLYHGQFFEVVNDVEPGGSGAPKAASWYWNLVSSCPTAYPQASGGPGIAGVLSKAQFELMFPGRDPFYTYEGFVDAGNNPALGRFANTGGLEKRKREVLYALANFSHETGELKYVEEIQKSTMCFADWEDRWKCEPGKQYYGRGPIQLSWQYNYGQAGDFIGQPLLKQPELVAQNPSIAWQTALWFWLVQVGPNDRPAHNCVMDDMGFGCVIRSINGALECDGGQPKKVQSRIDKLHDFKIIMGATTIGDDGC